MALSGNTLSAVLGTRHEIRQTNQLNFIGRVSQSLDSVKIVDS